MSVLPTTAAALAMGDRTSAWPADEPGEELGHRMHARMRRLYPICRSITGPGVRATLDILAEELDLDVRGVPTGTQVFDWMINDEWSVRDAYIARLDGEKVVDFKAHNLHLVSYSAPVRGIVTRDELVKHIDTLPDHPDWIPYRTSYYKRDWGFCVSQRQLDAMSDEAYEVVVDSSHDPGVLNYGELLIPGDKPEEVLFSAHLCHPSLANDNLSGITIAVELAKLLLDLPRRRYSYRFIFAPGTIGSLTWLSQNEPIWSRISLGLVLTGLGGTGPLVYKRTRSGASYVDRCLENVVRRHGGDVRDYSPYGYDERQYNAVGFGLPVGRLSRTPHNEYPEYHTSADNLDFVTPTQLVESLTALHEVIAILEQDGTYRNLSPFGEPQLGKRGLYPTTGGRAASDAVMAMLWVLAYSDGDHSLLDISTSSGMDFASIAQAADSLNRADLLAPTSPD